MEDELENVNVPVKSEEINSAWVSKEKKEINFEWVSTVAAGIEILSGIGSVIKAIVDKVDLIYIIIIIIFTFCFILNIVYIIFMKKTYKEIVEKSNYIIGGFKAKIKGKMRQKEEEQQNVLNLIKNCNDFVIETYYNIEYNYKKYKSNARIAYNYTRCFKEYTNYIKDIFKTFTGEEVTVTIRMYDKIAKEKSNSEIMVFAYSGNCDVRREQHFKKNKKIGENTDFNNIIDENIPQKYFYCNDVTTYTNYQNETQNSEKDCYEKFYKGRIVVPIEMEHSMLFYTSENQGAETIGFLTIDSLANNIFTEEKEVKYISFLKSQVELLYMPIRRYMYYVSKESGNDEGKSERNDNGNKKM